MRNKLPLKLIDGYQKSKPENSLPKCRYYPSCSNYAKECYQKFNFVKSSFLTAKRLLKCNPLFKGGYDPVPLTKEEKKQLKEKIKNAKGE